MAGWHVSANEINQWTAAHHREVQEILPLLIRKLIVASLRLNTISMPVGDSILVGGWDGILDVEKGNAFVPDGQSAWEFGTNQNIRGKADGDYRNRTDNPLTINKPSTTFVFATTRTFAVRDDWVASKNRDDEWKEVRALNSDDLDAWLEQCPAVHRWFARVVGKRPPGAWDLEQAWDNWSYATDPACNTELVLGGRSDAADKLCNQLRGTPKVVRVRSASSEEAYAFTLAALQLDPLFLPRLLVINDAKVWDDLIDSQLPLILLPRFAEQRSLGLAVQRHHHVISLESKQSPKAHDGVVAVDRADRSSLEDALGAMGLTVEDSKSVVSQSHGYLSVIRRHSNLAPQDLHSPAWAQPAEAAPLVAAQLAGSWCVENETDRQLLERLAGIPYADFDLIMHRWAVADDPPVRLIGTVWQVVSRQDAWSLLSPYINAAMLDRLGECVADILGEVDPRFELAADERWLANIKGKTLNYSRELRNGITDIVAMLGAYGDGDCQNVGPITVQDRVSQWVHSLLVDNGSIDVWRSLAGHLPKLAEASPEEFLRAVGRALQGDEPVIMCLFEDQGEWGVCLHSGLLWALESLSWNTDLLARVVRILAKLSMLDPGGRWSNRPSECLNEIFLGWNPQTTLPLERRMAVIDGLMRTEPEASWHLLLNLLPERGGGISHPIHQPVYRGWADGWMSKVTDDEYNRHTEAVAERVLDQVDSDPEGRWPEVLNRLPQLPQRLFDLGIEKLSLYGQAEAPAKNRKPIADRIRHIVSRHREFSETNWALPPEAVDRLDAVLPLYLPADLVARHRFLFDEDIPEISTPYRRRSYEERHELIEELRQRALIEIWNGGGFPDLERLAADTKRPWSLGSSLGRTIFPEEIQEQVFAWMGHDNHDLNVCAEAYVSSRINLDGTWINSIRELHQVDWTNEQWSAFCLGVPFGKQVFELLSELDARVADLFWVNVRYCYLQEEDSHYTEMVLRQLHEHNRPLAAIHTAAQYLHTIARQSGINGDLLAGILEKAATEPADQDKVDISSLTYDIVEVLRNLQEGEGVEKERLARIEWMFIHIFRWNEIEPKTLIGQILEDPKFFVHLICFIYKPHTPQPDEEREQPSIEVRRQRAENAYELLQSVKRIPGQGNGIVDTAKLNVWVQAAREGCRERAREASGDKQIGEILSFTPVGTDAVWPHESVRELLEIVENEDIERGIEMGRYNQRGVTSRAWNEGGGQERKLSEHYGDMAGTIQDSSPRSSAMLSRMAASYERDAAREDRDVDLRD